MILIYDNQYEKKDVLLCSDKEETLVPNLSQTLLGLEKHTDKQMCKAMKSERSTIIK